MSPKNIRAARSSVPVAKSSSSLRAPTIKTTPQCEVKILQLTYKVNTNKMSILAHEVGRWGGSYGELSWLCIWGVQTTPVDRFLTRDEEPSWLGGYSAGSSLFWAPTNISLQNWGQYLAHQFNWQICGALHMSLSSPANCSRTYSVLTSELFWWRLDISRVQYGKAPNL